MCLQFWCVYVIIVKIIYTLDLADSSCKCAHNILPFMLKLIQNFSLYTYTEFCEFRLKQFDLTVVFSRLCLSLAFLKSSRRFDDSDFQKFLADFVVWPIPSNWTIFFKLLLEDSTDSAFIICYWCTVCGRDGRTGDDVKTRRDSDAIPPNNHHHLFWDLRRPSWWLLFIIHL